MERRGRSNYLMSPHKAAARWNLLDMVSPSLCQLLTPTGSALQEACPALEMTLG